MLSHCPRPIESFSQFFTVLNVIKALILFYHIMVHLGHNHLMFKRGTQRIGGKKVPESSKLGSKAATRLAALSFVFPESGCSGSMTLETHFFPL